MVRDDMESGIVTSYKSKGIIIPELISLPFFLRSSNICLKNCFSDKFSLRAFIFPHAKFLKTRNLHLLWLQTKLCLILTTPWLPVYKRFFIATYICIWTTMYNHYANSHIRGVFGKYVDKCNRMRIKYTRRMKFCINKYELLNITYNQYENCTQINDLDIGH